MRGFFRNSDEGRHIGRDRARGRSVASPPVTLTKTLALPAAVAALGLAGLAGCGTTTIDSDKAETAITKAVTEQAGAKVKSVTCPEGKEAEKGATFTCRVVGTDGSTGDALVTMKDDKGAVNISAPFIHPRDVETKVAQGIEQQASLTDVKVTCPEIIPGKKGAKTTCQATGGGNKGDVLITQTDGTGGFDYKVQGSGGG